MMSATIYFAAENWGWPVAVFLLGSVILLWQGYRHYPARGWSRWVAATLKLAALVLLALCLMEPMWSGVSPKKGANDFVVIADNSLRFAVKNNQGQRLGEELADLLRPLEQNQDAEFLAQIAKSFRLRTYLLERVLKRVGNYEELDFSASGAGMISALSRLQDRFEGRPLAGMLVFTDGNVADRELIETFENRDGGAPLYPVIITGGELLQDLSLRGVEVVQSAFEDAPVTMTAEVHAQGLEGEGVIVRVKDGEGKVVATEARRIGTKGRELIRLQVPSSKAGVSFYHMDLSLSPGKKGKGGQQEATLENNHRLVAVDRKRGPYRILYVSGPALA